MLSLQRKMAPQCPIRYPLGKTQNAWVKVTQSCLTFCDPMDYTVYGILPARILKWVAFSFSRGPSHPRGKTKISHITGGLFTSWATRETQEYWSGQPIPSPVALPHPGIRSGSPTLQVDSLTTELSGKMQNKFSQNNLSNYFLSSGKSWAGSLFFDTVSVVCQRVWELEGFYQLCNNQQVFNKALILSSKYILSHFSLFWLCATPSLGFSRQVHWSGLPFPSPMHKSEKWKWSYSAMSDS